MRLVRFRFGDRIATGASEFESDTIRVLKGTFVEDPVPTGEEVRLRVAGVVRALENDGRIAWARPDRLSGLEPSLAVRLEGGADRAEVERALEALGAPRTPRTFAT